jgi:hypothetical protein
MKFKHPFENEASGNKERTSVSVVVRFSSNTVIARLSSNVVTLQVAPGKISMPKSHCEPAGQDTGGMALLKLPTRRVTIAIAFLIAGLVLH